MERLTDLKRLQELANEAGDQAEYAKLEAKIQKTLAAEAQKAAPLTEAESVSATPVPKRGKS
jgi:hypothetical protein